MLGNGDIDGTPMHAPERSARFGDAPGVDAGIFETTGDPRMLGPVTRAMSEFLETDDQVALEHEIAAFARSARARGEPVEGVLKLLGELADTAEGTRRMGFDQRETPLRQQILRRTLLEFYGESAVNRESAAREERVERRKHRQDPFDGEERRQDGNRPT